MAFYTVRLPVTGYVDVYVAAGNEAEAIACAIQQADYKVTGTQDTEPGEFEVHRAISRGGCSLAVLDEAEVVGMENEE